MVILESKGNLVILQLLGMGHGFSFINKSYIVYESLCVVFGKVVLAESRMLWYFMEKGCGSEVWVSNVVQGPYRVCLWQSVQKGWDTLHRFASFKVGDGLSIKFWHDS